MLANSYSLSEPFRRGWRGSEYKLMYRTTFISKANLQYWQVNFSLILVYSVVSPETFHTISLQSYTWVADLVGRDDEIMCADLVGCRYSTKDTARIHVKRMFVETVVGAVVGFVIECSFLSLLLVNCFFEIWWIWVCAWTLQNIC